LNIIYWQFFSQNPQVFLTDSIGEFFHAPVYPISTTNFIGYYFFGNSAINANTGIWMGWFAHFGLMGVGLVSILAGIILGLVDNLTRSRDHLIGNLTCAYFGFVWCEQMFHTSILSGGVLFLVIALLLDIKAKHPFNRNNAYATQQEMPLNSKINRGTSGRSIL